MSDRFYYCKTCSLNQAVYKEWKGPKRPYGNYLRTIAIVMRTRSNKIVVSYETLK